MRLERDEVQAGCRPACALLQQAKRTGRGHKQQLRESSAAHAAEARERKDRRKGPCARAAWREIRTAPAPRAVRDSTAMPLQRTGVARYGEREALPRPPTA